MAALAIEWREAARAGLLAIVDYISDDNPDAAQRLKDEIEDKVSKLPEHPRLYRSGRIAGTRETSATAHSPAGSRRRPTKVS